MEQLPRPPTRSDRPRILIAEDESEMASLLEERLRASGYDTAVAHNGAAALDLAESEPFDLVILDVGLPDRDGFSVLQELRARGRRVLVIILTAYGSLDDTVAGLEGGADDYIPKPFSFDELLARIRARLREVGFDGSPHGAGGLSGLVSTS